MCENCLRKAWYPEAQDGLEAYVFSEAFERILYDGDIDDVKPMMKLVNKYIHTGVFEPLSYRHERMNEVNEKLEKALPILMEQYVAWENRR